MNEIGPRSDPWGILLHNCNWHVFAEKVWRWIAVTSLCWQWCTQLTGNYGHYNTYKMKWMKNYCYLRGVNMPVSVMLMAVFYRYLAIFTDIVFTCSDCTWLYTELDVSGGDRRWWHISWSWELVQPVHMSERQCRNNGRGAITSAGSWTLSPRRICQRFPTRSVHSCDVMS